MADIIEIKNISKIYDDESVPTIALKDINLEIKEGEFVAVMGPSGSGKSTLLHILGLLDRPTKGEYRFKGKSIDKYTEDEIAHLRNEAMGFIFQSFNLLARTTVIDNVKLPLLYSSVPENKWDALAREAIDTVGLSHRIGHESSQLSGGEKQRVAIARALVNKPGVIFADEPTGNLDSKSGGMIMETIQELNEKRGHTVILITHEKYAAGYAERVLHLRDGSVESDEKVTTRNKGKRYVK